MMKCPKSAELEDPLQRLYSWIEMGLREITVFLALLLTSGRAFAGSRLDHIRKAGVVTCAVDSNQPGFAVEKDGADIGFDADICHAISAAIFGSPNHVRFVTISDVNQFLRSKDIDITLGELTWTFSREASLNVRFGPIMFYDGQAFLVPRSSKFRSAQALSDRRICVSTFERGPQALSAWFHERHLRLKLVLYPSNQKAWGAFRRGECSALSADSSALVSILLNSKEKRNYLILADRISKEPLAPLLRRGDDSFFNVVQWTVFGLIDAEELGISSKNVEQVRSFRSGSDAATFLSIKTPEGSGFDPHWTTQLIKAVGNYGEIYERNFGPALARGQNRLWTQGGLLYAPPVR